MPFFADPPWVEAQPELVAALLALDDATVDALDRDHRQLAAWLGRFLPALTAIDAVAADCLDHQDEELPATPPAPFNLPERLGRAVPGRKWQQILFFAAACAPAAGTRQLVDWCCGKAHLGRLLARQHGLPVLGLERDPALCAAGRALAAREQLPVQWQQLDVLRSPATALTPHSHAVALHACGDLHLTLMQQAAAAGCPALDIAPCCYHRTHLKHWQPLSAALADSALAALALSTGELRLAVQEAATASALTLARSRRLAGWRLGYDLLQRELRGRDEYRPTPSRPQTVLAAGFAAFCADLAAHQQLALPAGTDFIGREQAGMARLARVRRLELVRHGWRRPLEVLLVADRALWLEEQGYTVTLTPFCPPALTPRNLVLKARRGAAGPAAATTAVEPA